MPATLDELATDLQRFFAEKFPLDGDDGPGSVLLVFDNLGRPLSPKEFTGSGTAPARDLLAHQRAADLADQIPAGNALKKGWYLPRGGTRLSRWYANVLKASTGPDASSGSTALTEFEAAKAAAVRELDLNQLVLVTGTAAAGASGTVAAAGTIDSYYATSMSPVDWFTDESTDWGTYEIGAHDKPRPVPAGAQAQPSDGPVAAPAFTMMVAPDLTVPEIVQYVEYATITETDPPEQPDPDAYTLLSQDSLPRLAGQRELPFARRAVATNTAVVEATSDLALRVNAKTALAGTPSEPAASIQPDFDADVARRVDLEMPVELEMPIELVDLVETAPRDDFIDVGSLDQIAVSAAASSAQAAPAVVAATVPTPVSSNAFAVRFEYCLVRLDRPWWDDIFLHRHDWRLPGYGAGEISSGSAADPSGEITLITIGMLVIRNLSISANWTSEDLRTLPHCTSLGPFCIAAGGFDQAGGTLTRNGTQVTAWLCLVPPKMPAG